MATLTKEFHFTADAESWIPNPGEPGIDQAWFHPHKKTIGGLNNRGHLAAPPLQTMGGCLRTTVRQNTNATTSNWYWYGNWEDLGVPAGQVISTVKADYIWRVDLHGTKPSRLSLAAWLSSKGNPALASGPFEFLDGDNFFIAEFSGLDAAPDRPDFTTFPADYYKAYPVGSGADGVSFMPRSWQFVEGAELEVPGPISASNNAFGMLLWAKTPATLVGNEMWIRLKQDYVKLTISYAPAPAASQGNWFLLFD